MGVLPDVLRTGLKVVFCGYAVGDESARKGAYYATASNRFWRTLCETGLTPNVFEPRNYRHLLQYDIGLTDLVKTEHGSDTNVKASRNDIDELMSKVKKYKPNALAFNGKAAAKKFLGVDTVEYGPQLKKVESTCIFVLPSTSGTASRYWNIGYWEKLAVFVRE